MKEIEKALDCIRDIQLQIDEKCEQIKTTKERVFRITQVLDGMPKSPNQGTSKTETAVLSFLLHGHKLTNEIKQLFKARELAENDLTALLEDRRKQAIMKSRYIYNYSWRKIARLLNMSVSQVQKQKGLAINILEKKMRCFETF